MNELEKRMYFFVPYNISPIQQAIQAGHAALEYARDFKDDEVFIDFADNWKTWIILNGGTTNHNVSGPDGLLQGTLNQIATEISDNDINFSYFLEPDLNDALTAVCFICDERVFDYEKYPDLEKFILAVDFPDDTKAKYDSYRIAGKGYDELKELFPSIYKQWETSLGGAQNVFLRQLLKGKKLA